MAVAHKWCLWVLLNVSWNLNGVRQSVCMACWAEFVSCAWLLLTNDALLNVSWNLHGERHSVCMVCRWLHQGSTMLASIYITWCDPCQWCNNYTSPENISANDSAYNIYYSHGAWEREITPCYKQVEVVATWLSMSRNMKRAPSYKNHHFEWHIYHAPLTITR